MRVRVDGVRGAPRPSSAATTQPQRNPSRGMFRGRDARVSNSVKSSVASCRCRGVRIRPNSERRPPNARSKHSPSRYPAPSCRSLATAGCSGASRQPIDPFARLGCQNSPIWRSLGRVGDVGTRWDVPGEAQGRPEVCAVLCASVLEIIQRSFRRGESGSADARDEPGRLRTAHGGVLEEVSPLQPFFAGLLHRKIDSTE